MKPTSLDIFAITHGQEIRTMAKVLLQNAILKLNIVFDNVSFPNWIFKTQRKWSGCWTTLLCKASGFHNIAHIKTKPQTSNSVRINQNATLYTPARFVSDIFYCSYVTMCSCNWGEADDTSPLMISECHVLIMYCIIFNLCFNWFIDAMTFRRRQ